MPMYALATVPLIQKLNLEVLQVWYADDATAAGKLPTLREWRNRLTAHGPAFGYLPTPRRKIHTFQLHKPVSLAPVCKSPLKVGPT